jgi:hypothetical protein
VSERARAQNLGYTDPIFPTIEDTHKNYHGVIDLILSRASMMFLNPIFIVFILFIYFIYLFYLFFIY